MTTEEILAATAVSSWTLHLDRVNKIFAGFTDEQLNAEVAPGKNRLLYIWGHLAAVHDNILPLLGIGPRLHPELDAPFLTEADKASALPSATEVRRAWNEVNGALLEGFKSFTASDWVQKHNSVSDADFATNPLRNRLAVLLSRAGHISHHVGQLALAPK